MDLDAGDPVRQDALRPLTEQEETSVTAVPFPGSTVLGYPRIGPRRELKRALETYWDGTQAREELAKTAARVREDTWRRLAALALGALPSNTFSLYDQVLDTAVLLGAVPQRFAAAADP